MDYDLEPLRETELSDLRTHGIFQVPIMNLFIFQWQNGKGGKAKGNDNFPSWFLSENARYNLRTLFFPEANETFSEITIGHLKTNLKK